MIITRDINSITLELSGKYPVITITGPRQSGKTTLSKTAFPDYSYYSMEDPDSRELAQSDPRSFLSVKGRGMIIDEIQRVPELLSYIQGIVDEKNQNGLFILTGSHQFDLFSSITQSLAGRTAILRLLPFSFNEVAKMKESIDVDEYLFYGFYPAVYNRDLKPTIAYRNYFETYIQRDLRQIINIKDLALFQKFVRLCAGRIGQIFSASSLSNDIGVSVPTINSWVSILEASFIIFFLQPFYENIGKRLIKSPKIYFHDVGLASYLLGIETQIQIERDPLRGNLFENMIISELIKERYNKGLDHNLYFYRDSNKNEVDVIYKTGNSFIAAEIKAASTYTKDFLKGLDNFKKQFSERVAGSYIIFSGDREAEVRGTRIINYNKCKQILTEYV